MQRSSSLVSMSNGSKLDELPTWDPQSEASKKEVAQDSPAASLVHLVPVVIILCAIILWFFSYPETNSVANLRLVIGKNASTGQ
ncbi:uncharacterized protein LOC144563173 [Carex rostrata]